MNENLMHLSTILLIFWVSIQKCVKRIHAYYNAYKNITMVPKK
jgi:hypothetical protein